MAIVSEQTGTIRGTLPWITRAADKTADTDKIRNGNYRSRRRKIVTEGDKQFCVGVGHGELGVGDTEGDADATAPPQQTVQWMRYSDQNGSNPEKIGTEGSDTYEIPGG